MTKRKNVLETLLLELKDKDWCIRADAVRKLGAKGNADIIKYLIPMLKDEVSWVRQAAVEVLGVLEYQSAIEPLHDMLNDECWQVRYTVANALGILCNTKSIEHLLIALYDENQDVLLSVYRALGKIWGIPALIQSGSTSAGSRQKAVQELGVSGDVRVIKPLAILLRDESNDVRVAAAAALGRIGNKQAVEVLIDAKENWRVREAAAHSLGYLGDPRSLGPLIEALHDEADEVRETAVHALKKFGKSAVFFLITALKYNSRYNHRDVALALGKLGDKYAVKPLILSLKEKDNYVRKEIVTALGELCDKRAVQTLIFLLEDLDDDVGVRAAAAKALGKIGDRQASKPLFNILRSYLPSNEIRREAAKALGKLRYVPAVNLFILILQDSDDDYFVHQNVAKALVKIKKTKAREILISLLHNEDDIIDGLRGGDEHIKRTAYAALRILANEQMASIFISALQNNDKRIRKVAVEALGKIHKEKVIDPLIKVLEDKDNDVRNAAIKAIGNIGNMAITRLNIKLKDNNAVIRQASVETLGLIGAVCSIKPIMYRLKDINPDVRQAAINALIKINKKAVNLLIQELTIDDHQLCSTISFILGEIGDKRATRHLISIINNKAPKIRAAAITALGKLQDKKAVKSLVIALQDTNNSVRQAAAQSLANLADKRAVFPLLSLVRDKDEKVSAAAIRTLGVIGDRRATDTLIKTMTHKCTTIQEAAIDALGKLKETRIIKQLLILLKQGNWMVRYAAACALGKFDDTQGVRPLIYALKDHKIRSLAIKALGMSKNKHALHPFIISLNDQNKYKRWQAIDALGKMGDRKALEQLINAARDSDNDIKKAAITALGNMGKEAIEPLINMLETDVYNIQQIIFDALCNIGQEAINTLLAKLNDKQDFIREKVARILGKIGVIHAVEPLIATLNDTIPAVRAAAACALGKIKDIRAVNALISIINDKYIQESVVQALGELGDRAAVESLIPILEHESEYIQKAVIKALGSLGDPRAIPVLIKRIEDKDIYIRQAVIEALGKIGNEQTVDTLITMLQDSDYHIWHAVIDALVNVGDAAIKPLIVLITDSDREKSWKAAIALGELGDNAAKALLSLLEDPSWKVREAVAENLNVIGLIAVEPLIAALKDNYWQVKCAALHALGRIGDMKAAQPVTDALHDEKKEVRLAAVKALDNWAESIVDKYIHKLRFGPRDWQIKRERFLAIKALWTIAADSLAALLKDKDFQVSWAASFALGSLWDNRGRQRTKPIIGFDGGAGIRREIHEEELAHTPRYLNAGIFNKNGQLLKQPAVCNPKGYTLRINIGTFWSPGEPGSPLPETLLEQDFKKQRTLSMHIAIYSSDVTISPTYQTLELPREGDSPFIKFYLTFTKIGQNSISIHLLFKGHLLQSRRLEIQVVDPIDLKSWKQNQNVQDSRIVFSRISGLYDKALTFYKQTPRSLTIVADRHHQNTIWLRFYNCKGEKIHISQTEGLSGINLTPLLQTVRSQLNDAVHAFAGTSYRSPTLLAKHLGKLASAGRTLFRVLMPEIAKGKYQPHHFGLIPKTIIQIAPLSSQLSIPWELVYERKIETFRENRIKLCSAFHVHGPELKDCPVHDDPTYVCPHGFWGYRYIIEQLPHQVDTSSASGLRLVTAQINNALPLWLNVIVSNQLLHVQEHVDRLHALAPKSHLRVIHADKLDNVRDALIGNTIGDIIYFYAHGGLDEKTHQPYIEIGDHERIYLNDFDAWDVEFPHGPLVILNTCESAMYSPDSFENIINYFCQRTNASAVIGTQCQVRETLANDFIESFFRSFLKKISAGHALFDIRQYLLYKDLNPGGLVYSLFGEADVMVGQKVITK